MIVGSRMKAVLGFSAGLVFLSAAAGYDFPTCSSDSGCSSIAFSYCNDRGRCECRESYNQMNETACGRRAGDRCRDNYCDANNTRCGNGICVCKSVHTPNWNGTFCYKTPTEYGDLCNSTAECPDFGDGRECRDGRCICQVEFAFDHYSKTCKFKVDEIGARCTDKQICYLENDGDSQKVECIDGICQCRYTLLEDGKSCGEFPTCSSDSSCSNIAFSYCNDRGRCECREGYSQMNETACGRRAGDRCPDNYCDANNTRCANGICGCKSGHTPNLNGTFCYKTPTEYGDLCNSTAECPDFGDGRECRDGRCICQVEFAFDHYSKTCKYKVDEIDGHCNDNRICYLERDGDNQKVECIDETCQCRYKLSKDRQSCSGAAALLASTSGLLIMLLARTLT